VKNAAQEQRRDGEQPNHDGRKEPCGDSAWEHAKTLPWPSTAMPLIPASCRRVVTLEGGVSFRTWAGLTGVVKVMSEGDLWSLELPHIPT
jgi:hypothetical protein